jgi:glycosyltransferase involved in cell wall biosynthesis
MTQKTPLVSFVVPCYNYGRFLGDCLGSIFGQESDHDFEIVAIDDCSSDNTREVLEGFRDPRLRVILHETNQGHIRTISEGLQEARGKYVARIDADDRYRPCFLNETVARLEKFPEVGFVYGDAAIIGGEGEPYEPTTDTVHGGREFKGNELIPLLMLNFVCAPTVIARREAWLQALPIPADLAFSDWYYNLMIARRYEFFYVNRVLADYRVHSANHHVKIVRNRTEEPSIEYVLDRIFSEREKDPGLERKKQAARGRVYARQFAMLADRYFGADMTKDARRCYVRALRHSPVEAFTMGRARRLMATFLDPEVYRAVKRVLGRSAA